MLATDRFMRKVDRSAASGCWLWTSVAGSRSYGTFHLSGRGIGAHRAAWILLRGPIPEGMQICHHCDTPPCVNPEHLFVGTQRDNLADMRAKGRRVTVNQGAKNPMFGRQHSAAARERQARAKSGKYVGSQHPRATISEREVLQIRELKAHGHTLKAIAADLSVSIHVVGNVVARKSWRHV